MKKLRLAVWLLAFLVLSGCSTALQAQQGTKDDFFPNKEFSTNVEYYFYFLDKPIPSHFKPTGGSGGNMFFSTTAGRHKNEIVTLGEKNKKTFRVFVLCLFENANDFLNWYASYVNEAVNLGFSSREKDGNYFFYKNEKVFVFENMSGEFPGGRLTFGNFSE